MTFPWSVAGSHGGNVGNGNGASSEYTSIRLMVMLSTSTCGGM
eukprot:CAMPEP_0175698158 /NCGR_PEP_ID=MMETSP0097-20121207/33823_1 /TAXON_ID=311494 /ORGANISM="Alexandrium monilatum, Strain CCMP3105" /LENGTH=42 /DNA_ID= /DNA_START= /DNA_END= /DNA_ORIENTATION=